jgi:hypothetical protein
VFDVRFQPPQFRIGGDPDHGHHGTMKPVRLLALLLLLSAAHVQAGIQTWEFTFNGTWPDEVGTVTGRITFDTVATHAQPTMIEILSGYSDTHSVAFPSFTLTPDNSTFTGDFVLEGGNLDPVNFHASTNPGESPGYSIAFNYFSGMPENTIVNGELGAAVSNSTAPHFSPLLGIPEPSTYALFGLGLVAVAAASRLKRRKA